MLANIVTLTGSYIVEQVSEEEHGTKSTDVVVGIAIVKYPSNKHSASESIMSVQAMMIQVCL